MMEYIPHTDRDEQEMLRAIGVSSIEDLLRDLPPEVRLSRPLSIPAARTEMELRREIGELSRQNSHTDQLLCFLGAGAYDHYIPAAVSQLASRSEFYTAYTPYQAEMSQGILQSIYEYQTQICEITSMEVANASLYDGASALAEAALMGTRIAKKRKTILVSRSVNPRYREVLRTYLRGYHDTLVEIPCTDGVTDLSRLEASLTEDTASVLVQSPNFFGCIEDVEQVAHLAHRAGSISVCMADPLSLGVLNSPGEMGVDIAVGEGQALGNAINYGGPYLGFLAGRMAHVRQIPGRIVGATRDSQGRRGYCLTFQTREQHIKRDRATSNICTNQALNALVATLYLSLMGKEGLREVGVQCLSKAHYLREEIAKLPGFAPAFARSTFKEFAIRTPVAPAAILGKLLEQGILGGYDLSRDFPELDRHLLVCVTEKRTREEIDRFLAALKGFAKGAKE